jgi:hypothetical protein
MIMLDAEADESTMPPPLPYQPAIVKQYRPMSVRRSAFQLWNHIEGESVPMSLFNPFIVIGL